MTDAEAVALDHVLSGCSDIEQKIDEVILQQIDLVDIEEAAIGARQQSRLERLFAMRQRALQIERADHAGLGCAKRKIDDRHRDQMGLENARGGLAVRLVTRLTLAALRC